jgi:hypothetical protein
MVRRLFTVLFLSVGISMVYACRNPSNVFVIVLNNGESINISVFEQIGKKNINFYYDSIANGRIRIYSFRSHNDQNVMVKISNSGLVAFIVNTSVIRLKSYQNKNLVSNELDWLITAGILSIDKIERDKIVKNISGFHGSSIYYTKWGVLKNSSMIPEIDSIGNLVEWIPVDCDSPIEKFKTPPEDLNYSGSTTKLKSLYEIRKSNLQKLPDLHLKSEQ